MVQLDNGIRYWRDKMAWNSTQYKHNWVLNRIEDGICPNCGGQLGERKWRCPSCYEELKETIYKRRNRLNQEGKCIECGKENNTDNLLCRSCQDNANKRDREKYAALKEQNKCVDCQKDLGEDYQYVRCPECLAKNREAYRKYARRNK